MSDEFTDRLERLHGSRRRADQRSSENRNEGVYRAEDVEERPAESEEASGDDSADEDAHARSTNTDGTRTDANERDSGRGDGPREGDGSFDRRDRDRSEGDESPSGEESSDGEVSSRLKRAYRLRDKSGERTDGGRERASGDDKPEREREERAEAPDARRFTASKSRSGEVTSKGSGGDRPPPGEHVADLRRRAREHVDAGCFQKAAPLLREILALEPRHPFALRQMADFHRREGRSEYAERFEARLKDVSPF